MTNLLVLALAALEILGLGVHPLDAERRMTIARETVIVGDVLRPGVESPLVAWCRTEAPPSPSETRCFISPVVEATVAEASRRPVFRGAGLCGDSLLRLGSAENGILATTACANRPGIWAWVELLGTTGESRSIPVPVDPASRRDQLDVVPVPGASGGSWLVWIEAGTFDQDRHTARAIRLDAAGEPVGLAVDLSEPGTVLGAGLAGSHLAAARLPEGGLVAAWRVARAGGGASVRLRTFDAGGRPVSARKDLDSVLVNSAAPLRLITDTSGHITLSWWARLESRAARLYAASFSGNMEPLVAPAPVSFGTEVSWPQIAAIGTSGDRQVIAWADVDPETGEPRIGLRRWSPELGPLGLTTWIDGAVATSWPFLKLLPGDAEGTFTLYWKETLDDAMEGRLAILRWRDLRVGP